MPATTTSIGTQNWLGLEDYYVNIDVSWTGLVLNDGQTYYLNISQAKDMNDNDVYVFWDETNVGTSIAYQNYEGQLRYSNTFIIGGSNGTTLAFNGMEQVWQ